MKKTRDVILTVLTVGFLIVFGVLFLLLPKAETASEEENRVLASPPKIADIFKDGFKEGFAEYLADRFPARKTFVRTKAYSELLSGKAENNGVIFADGGYLISRAETDNEAIESAVEKALKAASYCEAAYAPTYFFLTGRTADVEIGKLPALYYGGGDEALRLSVVDALSSKAETADLTETLKNAAERGEYVYYKTDHHWTVYGAEYAYRAVADALGGSARSFKYEDAAKDFLGTAYSAAGLVSFAADTVTFVSFDGIESIEVTAFSRSQDGYSESKTGLYDEDALLHKDKYKAYLGGNFAEVRIRKAGKERQKLLVIKDSYFNCLAPMLAADYDMDVIDPRYMREEDVTAMCGSAEYSAVIFVYGIESFVN